MQKKRQLYCTQQIYLAILYSQLVMISYGKITIPSILFLLGEFQNQDVNNFFNKDSTSENEYFT